MAENDAQWYEERMLHCATCGRMIAKRYLAASVDGSEDLLQRGVPSSTTTTCSSSGADYQPPPNIGETYADLMVK